MSRTRDTAGRSKDGVVLDCSLVGAWFFADERSEFADEVARRVARGFAAVPSVWPVEVANLFLNGERRGRSTRAQATRMIGRLRALPIEIDRESGSAAWGQVLEVARSRDLTSYDAAYLELALRRGLPLATLDRKLGAAAQSAGVGIDQLS